MVSESRWLPSTLSPTLHRTDVSDSQDVCSHALIPVLSDCEYDLSPKLAPCTVIRVEPVAAPFFLPEILPIWPWVENPSDKVLTRRSKVTNSLRLLRTPCPGWQRTDVSDSHVVISHDV